MNVKPQYFLTAVVSCCICSIVILDIVYASNNGGDNPTYYFNIPPQPLDAALRQIAEISGIHVIHEAEIVSDKRTEGLQNRYSLSQALGKTLDSTGLTYRYAANNTIAVMTIAQATREDNPILLADSEVRGSDEGNNIPKDLEEGPDDYQTYELESTTIQGELIERFVQDSRTSAAVISGLELDRSNDTNFKDILDRTANAYSAWADLGIVIRGVSQVGVGGGGQGLLIDVNVDGASAITSQGYRTGALSTWDLEQVEILRGPQSTQQGRNSLAGSVIIRSKDPIFVEEFKARVDYGSFDETRLAVAGNYPLIEDTLALRLSAEDFHSDGYVKNPTRNEDNWGNSDLETLRGKLRFQPIEELNIVLGHTHSENTVADSRVTAAFPGRREFLANVASFEESDTDITNLRVSYDLNPEWSLFSETTYYITDYGTFQDAGGTAEDEGSGGRFIDDTSLSQELRASFTGEKLTTTAGIYYANISSDLDFDAVTPGNLFGFPPSVTVLFSNGIDVDVSNFAIFGEADYEFLPGWTLTVGARYDRETRDDTSFQMLELDPPITMFPATPPTNTETTFDAFLPKVGLTYDWNDDISTGLTVQRGSRAGGSGVSAIGEFEFDAEFTTNYELSLRSTWLDNRLKVNSNIFYTDWEDQQVTLAGPSGTFVDSFTDNAGESEYYGFELETEAILSDNLEVFASLGYVKTEFKEFFVNGEDLAGNEFPTSPNYTGSIGGTYYFDNGFFLYLVGHYTDRVYEDAQNSSNQRTGRYFIVNARVGYEMDNWSAHLYARNLLDEKYIIRNRDNSNSFDTAGEPQVIGISVSYNY